ncbi:MAG TPA: enoyl-CoA hydratase-related protein [Dehalococcoidia bacterium]|nr:enoyl-CoA hydratase-related protein [Dehalococcoidia bacterium]
MAYKYAIYEKRDRIAVITLNRPEVLNALHPAVSEELAGIWDDFAEDPNLWVAILTGTGRGFSAGNDLKATAARDQGGGEGTTASGRFNGGFGGITERFDLFKPVIAAVNGWAMGGGFEMVLACDIAIAAEEARFGLPEPRVGLVATAGGVHRLPRQIPMKQAMGMMLTGKSVDAQEAFRMGFVNEVVPGDQLMPTAERWANEILEAAPLSVRGSKESALTGLGLDQRLGDVIHAPYDNVREHMASGDRAEGPAAFAEKRTPQWTAKPREQAE